MPVQHSAGGVTMAQTPSLAEKIVLEQHAADEEMNLAMAEFKRRPLGERLHHEGEFERIKDTHAQKERELHQKAAHHMDEIHDEANEGHLEWLNHETSVENMGKAVQMLRDTSEYLDLLDLGPALKRPGSLIPALRSAAHEVIREIQKKIGFDDEHVPVPVFIENLEEEWRKNLLSAATGSPDKSAAERALHFISELKPLLSHEAVLSKAGQEIVREEIAQCSRSGTDSSLPSANLVMETAMFINMIEVEKDGDRQPA